MSDWRCYPTTGELDDALARHVAGQLRQDIAIHGAASLAVSGGGTPRNMFQRLSRCELDWSRVWITLVDERWVDPGDADSNERLVRQYLLQNKADSARFVGLKSAHADPAQGIAEISRRLARIPRPFTRVILGMGADGHTASWFPQAANLEALLDPAGDAGLGATDPGLVLGVGVLQTMEVDAGAGPLRVVLMDTGPAGARLGRDMAWGM